MEVEARARVAEEEARREARERERQISAHEATRGELAGARAEVERVEGEMRLVLRAMEQQKQAAQRNMSQLSRMCTEWQQHQPAV